MPAKSTKNLKTQQPWLSNSNKKHKTVFKNQIKLINNKFKRKTDKPTPKDLYVSFPAFLRFVASDQAHFSPKYQDVHWWRIYRRCSVCELIGNYDYIFKTETSNEDSKIFLDSLGLNWIGEISGPYTKNNSRGKSRGFIKQTSDIKKHNEQIKQYYRNEVDKEIVMNVYKMYKWDFRLFGYNLDGFVK